MKKKYTFVLYTAGLNPEDQQKICNLKKILQSEFGDNFLLEVVNVLENPDLTERQRILATPTIVRENPAPAQRCIIDLTNKEKLSDKVKSMNEEKRSSEK